MANGERLDWIFDSGPSALKQRYDQWAASYDDDHDAWGWRGPERVAQAALRLNPERDGVIYDAGCGTGKAGIALRQAGWAGDIVGLDFSTGMLDVAARSGVYTRLIACSLLDLPFDDDVATAVVSSGVFTHGHVGGEAFAELARIARPTGTVSITQRVDIECDLQDHAAASVESDVWREIERSEPELLHPDLNDSMQTITSWRTT